MVNKSTIKALVLGLAQFLVESQIPVVWDSEGVCGGSSCSRQFCTLDGDCSFEDGQPGIKLLVVLVVVYGTVRTVCAFSKDSLFREERGERGKGNRLPTADGECAQTIQADQSLLELTLTAIYPIFPAQAFIFSHERRIV